MIYSAPMQSDPLWFWSDRDQNTRLLLPVRFFMVGPPDWITPRTGLTITALRGNGNEHYPAWEACTGWVSEIGDGWYQLNGEYVPWDWFEVVFSFRARSVPDCNIRLPVTPERTCGHVG